ncbi:MAG: hypothetical protein R3B95_09765 [Nitrospirales bacterium]|nr:hypothetical protein [Nitrospirales bacterium]
MNIIGSAVTGGSDEHANILNTQFFTPLYLTGASVTPNGMGLMWFGNQVEKPTYYFVK